jgi:hypothetical protein
MNGLHGLPLTLNLNDFIELYGFYDLNDLNDFNDLNGFNHPSLLLTNV